MIRSRPEGHNRILLPRHNSRVGRLKAKEALRGGRSKEGVADAVTGTQVRERGSIYMHIYIYIYAYIYIYIYICI
jgi:hypothetical protein